MIYGIGVDIVKIVRIKGALERFGLRFQEKVFTPAENAYCSQMSKAHLHFALRFAAKEAFAKAIGLGMREGVNWKDIEVVNMESGKPTLNLYGPCATLRERLGIRNTFVSLSHEEEYGVAMVVLEV